MTLLIVETQPVQYHAPVYRAVQAQYGIPVVVVYESDASVTGYLDKDFGVKLAWDTDLLSGYTPKFLNTATQESNGGKGPSTGAKLAALLPELSPSAFLLQYYQGAFGWAAFREALHTKAPLLFRAETTDHALKRSRIKSLLRHQYLRWFYRHFDILLPIGRHSYSHYITHGVPADKLILSPYCVDTTPFQCNETDRDKLRPTARHELAVDEETLVLLFSGKAIAKKAPELLIEAAARLPQEIQRKVAVVFLGDGPLRPSLAACSAPNLTVTFLGFRNQTQLSPYFHAADLLVLPSRSGETWGLVVNEALHHGLPSVVSSAVGSAPDLILPGETGEIFASENVDALVAALKKASGLCGRPAIRERCRAQVDKYTVQQAAAGIARAYARVLERSQHV